MLTPSLFEALAIHVICSLVLIFLVGGIFCSSSAKTVSLLSAVHFSLLHLFTYGDPSTFHFPKLSMVEYGLDVLLHTIRHIIIILSKYDAPYCSNPLYTLALGGYLFILYYKPTGASPHEDS